MLGGVFALLLHVALVPVWGLGLSGMTDRLDTLPPEEDKPLPTPQEAEVGKAHASVTNIAWIAYDDFRELLAKHEAFEQPALQRQEDPAPNAPIEMDPTPPAPNADPTQPSAQPGDQATDSQAIPVPISPVGPVLLPSPQYDGQIPYVPQGPMPRDVGIVMPNLITSPQQPTDNPIAQKPSNPGQPNAFAKPTAAPRDLAEAQPVTIIPGIIRLRPGKVLTADGIEINTVALRPSAIALNSTIPKNAKAQIWLSNAGHVTHVEITQSTGAGTWDDFVYTSLEQWTATGERIDELKGELRLTVELILR